MQANDDNNQNREEAHRIPTDHSASEDQGGSDQPLNDSNDGVENNINQEEDVGSGARGGDDRGNYTGGENGGNMHPNGPQFMPPFDPNHSPFGPPVGANASYGHPNASFQYGLPPAALPPMLPPPPSMSMPPAYATNPHAGPSNLDATRQYYEARMREHAMQYANAAAGAAWAAARIACGDNGMGAPGNVGMHGYLPNQSAPSYYTPASAPPLNGTMMGSSPMNPDQQASGPRQKRTLWHPPSSPENKIGAKVPKKGSHTCNADQSRGLAVGAAKHSGSYNEKKRSKKRESGNDSVSSLGSGSRDLNVGGKAVGGKQPNKKGNQRRRFNDDASPASNADSGRKSDNHRQKRGLHHGHGSKSSLSSFGSNPHHSAGRNRKKNRSQHDPLSSSEKKSNRAPAGVHLGGLIGKNGARALHELCSKYRWEMPKYTPVEPEGASTSANDANSSNDISFVLVVHVNGVELGRGRGSTKAAAKQDASRKALAAMVPGAVFDPNGILLDVGSELMLRGSNINNAGDIDGGNYGFKSLSLDELGPHLASHLAIGGVRSRPMSPAHSEDSSISTKDAVSLSRAVEEVISGGPLSQKFGFHQSSPGGTLSSLNTASGAGRAFSSNIYPCASTTSGVSSASEIEDGDENAYYSSRGASVCSTLLHAMWQIDDRIREPPFYDFNLRSGPVTGGHLKDGSDASPAAQGKSSKRKKVESSPEVAVHRMFQCNATLNIFIYFPKDIVVDNNPSSLSLMDYWESPLDYLQSKTSASTAPEKGECTQSRKRKDSFANESTTSPNGNDGAEEQAETPAREPKEKEELVKHKLEGQASGSTKRESKHKASAKLLAALFPSCKSMVEVKAEAEAARELYAAGKAAAIQTKRVKLAASSPERKQQPNALPTKGGISLQDLSLTDNQGGSKRIKWSDSTASGCATMQNKVDAALLSLQELEEDGRSAARELSVDDVGRIILRRANLGETDSILALLNKEEQTPTSSSKKKRGSDPDESADSEVDAHDSENVDQDATEESGNAADEFGDQPIVLLLSRAVALDPPLGCAILTLQSTHNEGRDLVLRRLSHEEHLPRERFVDCLEAFAKSIQCSLDTHDGESSLTHDDVRSLLLRSLPLEHDQDDAADRINGNPSHSHLQSVKEEESDEVDDGSEAGDESDKKVEAEGAPLIKGKPTKPCKRSRVS